MDPEELKQRLITIGKASVLTHETEEYAIRGGLVGFDLCKPLHTPQDFEQALAERHMAEHSLFDLVHSGKAAIEDYYQYRCATLQIGHVFERMKVLWGYTVLYASAVIHVAEIMADWQKAMCN